MNFKQLIIFVKVAELGSFAKAAQELYLSVSALTQQLNTLERYLGCILFERTSKGSVLTESGKKFLDYANRLIALEKEAKAACASTEETIHIGSYHGDSAVFLQDSLLKFASVCPEVNIHFVSCNYRDFFSKLRNGEIDIFVHPYDEKLEDNGFRFLPMCKTGICCNMNAGNPLLKKDRLKIEDLRGRKIIVSCGCQSHCLDDLIDYLRKNEPQVCLETISSDEEAMEKIITKDYIMLNLLSFSNNNPSYRFIPLDWGESIDFGVISSDRPSKPVKRLLNFLSLC